MVYNVYINFMEVLIMKKTTNEPKIIPNKGTTKKGPMSSPFEGINSLSSRHLHLSGQCSQKPKEKA